MGGVLPRIPPGSLQRLRLEGALSRKAPRLANNLIVYFFVGFLVHKSSVCGCYKCLVSGNTDRYIVSCCAAPSY